MLCNQFEKTIDDYLDGHIDDGAATQIALHMQACPSCLHELEERQAIRKLLAELPVTAPREDFFEEAVTRAARIGDSANSHRRWRYGGALAAAFAFVFAASVVFERLAGSSPDSFSELPQVVLDANTVTPVKLVFSSQSALRGARLTIQLPVGVELAGYNGRTDLSWTTDLEPGKNILRLPLVGRMSVSDQLVAKLEHPSGTKTFRLQITVN